MTSTGYYLGNFVEGQWEESENKEKKMHKIIAEIIEFLYDHLYWNPGIGSAVIGPVNHTSQVKLLPTKINLVH